MLSSQRYYAPKSSLTSNINFSFTGVVFRSTVFLRYFTYYWYTSVTAYYWKCPKVCYHWNWASKIQSINYLLSTYLVEIALFIHYIFPHFRIKLNRYILAAHLVGLYENLKVPSTDMYKICSCSTYCTAHARCFGQCETVHSILYERN